jgi:hypothetical protein
VRLPIFTAKLEQKRGAIIQIDKDHSVYSLKSQHNSLQRIVAVSDQKKSAYALK